MSPGSAWKGRVPPGYSGVGSASFVFVGTFIPGFCIHRDILLEEAIVTHLVTCHGRDHLVNIQLGATQPHDCQCPF